MIKIIRNSTLVYDLLALLYLRHSISTTHSYYEISHIWGFIVTHLSFSLYAAFAAYLFWETYKLKSVKHITEKHYELLFQTFSIQFPRIQREWCTFHEQHHSRNVWDLIITYDIDYIYDNVFSVSFILSKNNTFVIKSHLIIDELNLPLGCISVDESRLPLVKKHEFITRNDFNELLDNECKRYILVPPRIK